MRTGKKVQNVVSVDTYQRITPPTRWSMASNLSVAKKRSAKTPIKNGDTIAAMAVVMYAAPTWGPLKCRVHDDGHRGDRVTDRKSTRLNSSHVRTSYAVFCL